MTKEFIPYEIALALKELGFDEPCFGYYNEQGNYIGEGGKVNSNCNKPGMYCSYCTAPTFSQAFRWFRDKHNLHGCIDLQCWFISAHWYIRIDDIIKNDYLYHSEDENLKFETYEEAELACLNKLIETFKNK